MKGFFKNLMRMLKKVFTKFKSLFCKSANRFKVDCITTIEDRSNQIFEKVEQHLNTKQGGSKRGKQ